MKAMVLQRQTWRLPRTLVALLISGFLAPLLFVVLLLAAVAVSDGMPFKNAAPSINEAIWFLMVTLVLGEPSSLIAALVIGLPSVYLARRLRLTSLWVFSGAGAALGLGCTAWFAKDRAHGLAEWVPFASTAALTGAICGGLCGLIAERPCCAGGGLAAKPMSSIDDDPT